MLDISEFVKMPEDMNYIGSFFAWSPSSVFTEEIWDNSNFFPSWGVYILCLIPATVTFILATALVLVCAVASLIPFLACYIILMCTCHTASLQKIHAKVTKSVGLRNFWKEVRNF